jgi:hypothetical protein
MKSFDLQGCSSTGVSSLHFGRYLPLHFIEITNRGGHYAQAKEKRRKAATGRSFGADFAFIKWAFSSSEHPDYDFIYANGLF